MIKKKAKTKKKKGRPSKYKPEYCQEIIRFFSVDPYREVTEIVTYKDGTTKECFKQVANDIPFLFEFARKIGVNQDTLHEWERKHKEFSEALKGAKELQKAMLIRNGLLSLYQPTFSIFTAKNITDMRDQTEVKHEGEVNLISRIPKPIRPKE